MSFQNLFQPINQILCVMCTDCYFAILNSLFPLFLRSDSDLMKILDRQNIRRDKMDFLRVYDNTTHRTKVHNVSHVILNEQIQVWGSICPSNGNYFASLKSKFSMN